jgi:hypothetical protein
VAKAWLAQAIKKHTAHSAAPAPGKQSSPAPGTAKVFRLTYTDAGESKVFLLPEGDTFVGPPAISWHGIRPYLGAMRALR